jgi:hypothetical protein
MNIDNVFATIIFIMFAILANERWKLYKIKKINTLTRNRFSLFAMRDQFVHLVASGDLKEDDIIYKFFVSYINLLIRGSKKLTVKNMIIAITKASQQKETGVDITVEYVIDRVAKTKNPKIKDAVSDLFKTIAFIVYENSPVLQLIIWIHLSILKPIFGEREVTENKEEVAKENSLEADLHYDHTHNYPVFKEKVKKVVIKNRPEAKLYFKYDRDLPDFLERQWITQVAA